MRAWGSIEEGESTGGEFGPVAASDLGDGQAYLRTTVPA